MSTYVPFIHIYSSLVGLFDLMNFYSSLSSDNFYWREKKIWRKVFVLPILVMLHSTQEPRFDSVFGMSVLLVKKVISYKTDVTNYMCNFPVCISTFEGCPF